MFRCLLGDIALDGDHLDLNYRDPERWSSLTPRGAIRSICFDIGDPVAGPTLQLGLVSQVPGDEPDWKHNIDPVHHHGSDQFRIISGGDWILANRPMTPGGFSFQESGWDYQEHPTPSHQAWMALLMGDRRGSRSTVRFARDKERTFQAGEAFGQAPADVPYPHPAGDKGVAAVETTLGRCEWGYIFVEPTAVGEGEAVTGLLGDPAAGPVVHVLRGGAMSVVAPTVRYATEVLLVVAQGSCSIAGETYSQGDMRLQAPDAPFDIRAGADGVELAMMVADRRARPQAEGEIPAWMSEAERLAAKLKPVQGGFRRNEG